MDGACTVKCMGQVRKLEGKKPLGRPKHIWEDIIKMDLREI